MSLIEIKWHPVARELRYFARIGWVILTAISLLLYFVKGVDLHWALIPFAVGLIIFLTSLVSLKLTRIIYLALVLLTAPIGLVLSFVVMTAFYFFLLTPLGFLFRLIRRDALCRKIDPAAKSYWRYRKPHTELSRYFRQF